jgi:hypothetical protein
MNTDWIKINSNAYKGTYQLDDEPIIIHIIKTGEVDSNNYFVIHEDGWGINDGKVEILNKKEIIEKYKLNL